MSEGNIGEYRRSCTRGVNRGSDSGPRVFRPWRFSRVRHSPSHADSDQQADKNDNRDLSSNKLS